MIHPVRNKPAPYWLWAVTPADDLINAWAQFRTRFEINTVPETCPVRVTADRAYRLFVNGEWVVDGPCRGFAETWFYDSIDLAPFLKPGSNVIAALAHNPGIGSHSYIHSGYAGFILEGSVGDLDFSTSRQWYCRHAPDWIRGRTRLSIQLGWQEIVDARRADGDWLAPDYDPSDWPPHYYFERPWGSAPWHSPRERDIPLLRTRWVTPTRLVGVSPILSGEAESDTENIATRFRLEGTSIEPVDRLIKGGTCEISPQGEDDSQYLVFDLAEEVFASISLRISHAIGGECIDLLLCEATDNGRPVVRENEGCKMATAHRYICRKGDQVHETFWPLGGCVLALAVRGATRGLRIAVQLRHREYPFESKGFLESPTTRAGEIYDLCRHTQQLCSSDTYVDCPGREQAMWWGDAETHFANSSLFAADDRLFVRGIRLMEQQRLPNGLTYAHAPTKAHECIIPDFTLAWVRSFYRHYWFTGDPTLTVRYHDSILRALSYFYDQAYATGLLPRDPRYWLFLDWAETFKDGFLTLYNLEYLETLQQAADVFRAAGRPDTAREMDRRASLLRAAILERLWNRAHEEPYDGLHCDGTPQPRQTLHTLVRCILLDIHPEAHHRFATDHLLPFIAGERPRGKALYVSDQRREVDRGALTPYFMQFAFRALIRLGYRAEVLDCILRWWGDMLDRGLKTTEECWDAEPGVASLCHAWAAHPIQSLSEIMLGVRQLEPGWKTIQFDPLRTPNSPPCRGVIDTPLGPIRIDLTQPNRDPSDCVQAPSAIEIVLP